MSKYLLFLTGVGTSRKDQKHPSNMKMAPNRDVHVVLVSLMTDQLSGQFLIFWLAKKNWPFSETGQSILFCQESGQKKLSRPETGEFSFSSATPLLLTSLTDSSLINVNIEIRNSIVIFSPLNWMGPFIYSSVNQLIF